MTHNLSNTTPDWLIVDRLHPHFKNYLNSGWSMSRHGYQEYNGSLWTAIEQAFIDSDIKDKFCRQDIAEICTMYGYFSYDCVAIYAVWNEISSFDMIGRQQLYATD